MSAKQGKNKEFSITRPATQSVLVARLELVDSAQLANRALVGSLLRVPVP